MSKYYGTMQAMRGAPNVVPNTDYTVWANKYLAVKNYKETAIDLLQLAFPSLTQTELEYAVDRSIAEHMQWHEATIDNSYKKSKAKITLPDLTNYILSKGPIMTNYGVLFTKHATVPHPLYQMVDNFINTRDVMKKEMFKHPKGSFDFNKYSLLQLLYKLDANALYGSMGMPTCFYYNFYTAAAITTQGRSLNSAMALFFESFLANNVPFASLNEVVVFINDTIHDPFKFDDRLILTHQATLEEAFFKVMTSTGFNYIPSEDDMELVWNMMSQLTQAELNRLYYKNNLYEFCDNPYVTNLLVNMLCKLESEWGDSNKIPEEIKPDMEHFKDLLRDYVYSPHQIIDRTEKMDCLIRSVSIIQDTDSAIVSYDAWYQFLLQKCRGVDMKIKKTQYDYVTETTEPVTYDLTDFDFENDELIEAQRLAVPFKVIPQDQLRHSILAIIAHCLSVLLNDLLYEYCNQFQAILPENEQYPRPKGYQCLMLAKTEFLFKRILLTEAKKHYASYQELQEGHYVPKEEALDTKGMDAFNKSTSNAAIKVRLKKVLFEDILDTPVIDQVKVVKSIATIEKEIFNSIQEGKKEFYKPAKIKSTSAYVDPMRIQGIKAAIAYNAMHQTGTEVINLDQRNSIDIAKVNIDKNTIERIKDDFPDVYAGAVNLMQTDKAFASGIDCIAIPINEPVPEWILPFVAYEEIISDNVGNFPLESIGLTRGNPNNNRSTLVKF